LLLLSLMLVALFPESSVALAFNSVLELVNNEESLVERRTSAAGRWC
jgi:hypothetical protein